MLPNHRRVSVAALDSNRKVCTSRKGGRTKNGPRPMLHTPAEGLDRTAGGPTVRTIYRPECVRRTENPSTEQLTAWARAVVADPAAHRATEREAAIVASLLEQMGAAR